MSTKQGQDILFLILSNIPIAPTTAQVTARNERNEKWSKQLVRLEYFKSKAASENLRYENLTYPKMPNSDQPRTAWIPIQTQNCFKTYYC